MNEIMEFTHALHKCSNEKLLAFLERLENDEWDLENNQAMYDMAIAEATERGVK